LELTFKLNTRGIIRRISTDDKESYALLYKKYSLKVYNSVCRIINNYAEAEDIVQDAFCVAFEKQEFLRDQENFEGWVKRIALNKAISYLRKNKMVFVEESQLDVVSEEIYDKEEEILLESKVDDIKAAIQKLPDGYRTIIVLHLFENISQEKIAVILNISHSTVRSQYHRAKKKVLSILKETSNYGK
jgi:RNA polymerase sigma-70 factor (ECF subfamily)